MVVLQVEADNWEDSPVPLTAIVSKDAKKSALN